MGKLEMLTRKIEVAECFANVSSLLACDDGITHPDPEESFNFWLRKKETFLYILEHKWSTITHYKYCKKIFNSTESYNVIRIRGF